MGGAVKPGDAVAQLQIRLEPQLRVRLGLTAHWVTGLKEHLIPDSLMCGFVRPGPWGQLIRTVFQPRVSYGRGITLRPRSKGLLRAEHRRAREGTRPTRQLHPKAR